MENSTNQIVPIDTSTKQRAIYNYTKETTDFTTGEIISKDELKISKEDKKENFIKIFIDNLYFMATNLNNSEKTILFFIIANMNYKNVITISAELRKLIEKKSGISRSTIFTAINGLKEKNVLLTPLSDEAKEEYSIYSKNSYVLNPNVIGKGSIKDLKKLRQTVVTDFDFDKLEATQEVIRQF
jgi:predicted transcriptional regulator